MDKKTRDAIGDAVARGLHGIETRLDSMNEKVAGLCSSMGSIEQRLSTLEGQLQGVDNLVEAAVEKEVKSATRGLQDDVSTLEMKVDRVQEQLAEIKVTNTNKDIDESSVIIHNLAVEDENKLIDEVKDIFTSVLEISVHVNTVDRFKTYSKNPGPIRVQLASKEEVVTVMKNKNKLMEYQNLDKVHIEAFMTKADMITRDNWNTVIHLLGNAGKGVRVTGTGRIVKKAEHGDQRPPATGATLGGEAQMQPTTDTGDAVSGTSGGPTVPGANPLAQRAKKKKKRRPRGKNGTNNVDNSQQVAPDNAAKDSDTVEPASLAVVEIGTTNESHSAEMAAPPNEVDQAELVNDEYVVVQTPQPATTGPEIGTKPTGTDKGPNTRAKAQKAGVNTEPDAEKQKDETVVEEEESVSPIKKSINALGKKIWSNKTK